MTEQTAVEGPEKSTGSGDSAKGVRRLTFFSTFDLVFASISLITILGAGLASASALGGDVGDVSIGVALGLLYVAVSIVAHRIWTRRRRVGPENHVDQLRNTYDSIVAVLCAALDLRDNVAHGHARRMSQIASIVAWQMGLRKEQVRQIEKAAILHDIGKIGVADAVLAKPGPLNDSEWAEMKRHPELGERMIRGIDLLSDAAEIISAHHERHDGSGYPRGLKRDEIPVGARVFAVVDAYDAMTSHRPYRKAMPHRKAVSEIVRNGGTQFDPDVVRAFIQADRLGLLENDLGGDGAQPEPMAALPEPSAAGPATD